MTLTQCEVCDNTGESGVYYDMTQDCLFCDGAGVVWMCEICKTTGDGPTDLCRCDFDDLEKIYQPKGAS